MKNHTNMVTSIATSVVFLCKLQKFTPESNSLTSGCPAFSPCDPGSSHLLPSPSPLTELSHTIPFTVSGSRFRVSINSWRAQSQCHGSKLLPAALPQLVVREVQQAQLGAQMPQGPRGQRVDSVVRQVQIPQVEQAAEGALGDASDVVAFQVEGDSFRWDPLWDLPQPRI
ncbi:hypothetical protein EYF80_007567 [Liparis tanakae]|uniref:Uncharacterized protein n=1 Tax=Liparis tanakae TaxID=230148 RepID=A0A4Z2IW37_9TELE|nr:hypothetical protein EYF80_007567 [Liparis tanakae]